jgi:hypothetical protein
MAAFSRYIGIDYSGAETPESSLKGLRVYCAVGEYEAKEVAPPPSRRKYWTRRGIAHWLAERLAEDVPTIAGIDHGFSFPLGYFVQFLRLVVQRALLKPARLIANVGHHRSLLLRLAEGEEGCFHRVLREVLSADLLGEFAGKVAKVVSVDLQHLRELLDQVVRRRIAAIALDVVEVLRRDRFVVLLAKNL